MSDGLQVRKVPFQSDILYQKAYPKSHWREHMYQRDACSGASPVPSESLIIAGI